MTALIGIPGAGYVLSLTTQMSFIEGATKALIVAAVAGFVIALFLSLASIADGPYS